MRDRKLKVCYYKRIQVAKGLSRQAEDLCYVIVYILLERMPALDDAPGQYSLRLIKRAGCAVRPAWR